MEKRTRMVQDTYKIRAALRPRFSHSQHMAVVDRCQDVPEAPPRFPMAINRVGITEKTVWIRLPQGLMPFEAQIFVDLPPQYKGIHMSRMEQSMSELFETTFDDIRSYTRCLAKSILMNQQGSVAEVKVTGKIPLTLRTSVSNKISLDSVQVSSKSVVRKRGDSVSTRQLSGIGLTHITACPCTQVYNRELFNNQGVSFPYPTHSQRCITWLEIETSFNESPSHQELVQCLCTCLHMSQDLLKRPDEAELVLKSHREPQFAEDVVREVAFEAGKRFGGRMAPESVVRINTTSLESIHNHNVSCTLECPLGDIMEL